MRLFGPAIAVVSAVLAAINGGTFFAFSAFVMRSLAALPTAQGVAAMQSINRFAPQPLFMTALFGAVATGAVATLVAAKSGPVAAGAAGLGTVLSIGTVTITGAYNVPRNDALAAQDAGSVDAATWGAWVSEWTSGNTVRAVTALAAVACFAVAARHMRG